MGCKECGKPKCNGKCGCKSPKVLQINNPAEYITFHKVSIPVAMGDSTTNPPKIGAYRNALVYYEADHTSWMYSTDGIPTKLTNGLTDYNEAVNLPQINGHTLIGDQSSSNLGLQGELTAGTNIQINGNVISATDTTYTAGNGIELDGTEIKAKIGDGLEFDEYGGISGAIVPDGFFTDTTKTVSGRGTAITLNDTANAIFKDIKLYGDTYQQSYTGKNLCSPVTEGFFINNTANRVGKTDNDYGVAISVKNNTSYTISSKSNQIRYRVTFCDTLPTSTVTVSAYSGVNADNTQRTITIDSSTHSYLVVNASELSDIQVEEGSTATSYEPYVGGIPSPNPDYPQAIQTATGTQTISINGTDYPLDLGSIELCKLGTYQDYIYKDGDDWKIHKAIEKAILPDDIDGNNYGYRDGKGWAIQVTTGKPISGGNGDGAGMMYSDKLQSGSRDQIYGGTLNIVAPPSSGAYFLDMFMNPDAATGQGWGNSQFYAWLEENPITVYYIRATAVEEEITDIALISQLEELREAKSNESTIVITISGSLTATLSVTAFKNGWTGTISGINAGIDNKADKWLVEQKPFYFNSVAEMKAYNLNDGDLAITTGYYSANDGGGARYTITAKQLTADNAFVVELSNGAYAKLVIENNQVNIRQLGARSQDTNNTKYDIAPYINKYMATAKTSYAFDANKISLYIPSGVWYSSPLEISGLGYSIIGDEQFIDWWNRGTIISSILNNQDYIFKFSNSVNFVLKNICFSTADFTYNRAINSFITNAASVKSIGSYCVRFERMSFGDTDNLYFQHINGTAFELASSWEIRYRKLMFRQVDAHDSCVMKFDTFVSGAPGNGGVNASSFDNMMFEHVLGHLMYLEPSCNLYNCYFGIINFEDNKITRSGVTYTTFNSSNISTFEASNPVHFAVFCLGEAGSNMGECTIDTIQLNNFSTRFSTIGTQNYCYDNIFRVIGDDSLFNVIVNNIDSLGITKNPTILYSHDTVAWQSSFILNNLNSIAADDKYYVYDVDKFTYIRQDGRRMSQVNSVIPKLTNTATPAYIAIANRAYGRNNMLTSDSAIKNELGIGVKLLTYFASLVFLQASGKLYIRAKIPNGQTARILISGDNINQPVNLTGTGSFNIYEVTLDSNSPIGNVLNVALASQNTADYCLVDYFIN